MMMDVNSPRAGRLPQRLAAGKHEARAKSRDTSEKIPARWKMIHAASVYSNSFSCGRQCYQNEYFSANCRILGPPEVGPEPAEQPEPLLFVEAFAALQRILPKVLALPRVVTAFGQIPGALDPRIMQFALKYAF